jgi:hypothetical protein
MAETLSKAAPGATTGTPANNGEKKQRGGRRVPEGFLVKFYLKNDVDVQQLKKLADEDHRNTDNMAEAIVRKTLKGAHSNG